jgi:hypothetical protein
MTPLERVLPIARRLAAETPPAAWTHPTPTSAGRWPCCSFLAMVLHEVSGRGRLDPADVASAVAPGWWGRGNVWAGESPWSALDAARELLPWGGDGLIPGCLAVVQTWDGTPGASTGHTWLACVDRVDEAGTAWGHRIESSIARRVRLDGVGLGSQAPGPAVRLDSTARYRLAVSLGLPAA